MRPLLAVALLTVLLPGLALWHQYRQDGHERALGAIASELAGRPVDVRCQGLLSDLRDVSWQAGEVIFDHTGAPPDETTLKRSTCRQLADYPAARERRFGCVHRIQRCPARITRSTMCPAHTSNGAWTVKCRVDGGCAPLQTT